MNTGSGKADVAVIPLSSLSSVNDAHSSMFSHFRAMHVLKL